MERLLLPHGDSGTKLKAQRKPGGSQAQPVFILHTSYFIYFNRIAEKQINTYRACVPDISVSLAMS